jgi:hypothetical protein
VPSPWNRVIHSRATNRVYHSLETTWASECCPTLMQSMWRSLMIAPSRIGHHKGFQYSFLAKNMVNVSPFLIFEWSDGITLRSRFQVGPTESYIHLYHWLILKSHRVCLNMKRRQCAHALLSIVYLFLCDSLIPSLVAIRTCHRKS